MAYLGLDIPHPWASRALNFKHVDVGGDATFGSSDFYLPSINVSKISGNFYFLFLLFIFFYYSFCLFLLRFVFFSI